jgi:hypothetical protein
MLHWHGITELGQHVQPGLIPFPFLQLTLLPLQYTGHRQSTLPGKASWNFSIRNMCLRVRGALKSPLGGIVLFQSVREDSQLSHVDEFIHL